MGPSSKVGAQNLSSLAVTSLAVRSKRFFLSRWCDLLYALERGSVLQRSSDKGSLPPELVQVEGFARERALIVILQSLICRFPFWLRGHMEIAELLLQVGELEASYAACQTSQILAVGTRFERPVQLLLGRVYFAYGQYQSVLETLASIPKNSLSSEELELLGYAERANAKRD